MGSPVDPSVLYDEAPCGLLLTCADGAILRVNQTLCGWLGYGADELIGRLRFQDLLSIGCKIFHQTHWMPLLAMQGSVAEVQLDLRHKDGRVLPMLVNAVERRGEPTTHHLALFIATDRRKYERELLLARRNAEELLERERQAQAAQAAAEAELRLALAAARLRVWSLDLASGQLRYGRGAGELIGRPELDEVDGAAFHACMHPDDREAERAAFAAALDPQQRAPYRVEYRLEGRDGAQRVVAANGRATFDAQGKVTAFSGLLQDVSERHQAQRLLQERAVLAEQLVGIVSHDLRTPLNAIVLGAHLLSTGELTAAQRRATARIGAAATRATRLTGDLLDFTQARLGGGLRIEARDTDVHDPIAECIEEIRLAWPGRMLEHRRLGSGTAHCDPDRLCQLVTNLTNNALNYGSPEQPVTVTTAVSEPAVELRVHNHGPPIPEALLGHIFEPLRRGEQQVKLGSRSVGLGLYIVREIAAAHGGAVSVQSSEAEGTTFSVVLPRDPVRAR